MSQVKTIYPATEHEHWPEPEPIEEPGASEQPYPVEALGSILGGAANAIAEHSQCPLAMAGQAVLIAAAFAVQGQIRAWSPANERGMPVSLFALTLADSGDRKSTADRRAFKPVYEIERELDRQFKELKSAHAEMEQSNKKKSRKGGKHD